MDNKNLILVAIAILVIVLAALGVYIATTQNSGTDQAVNASSNKTVINVDLANNSTGQNATVVGDNSPRVNETANNTTYKVYNPQSDSYVDVIGEKFDADVSRWYTYDSDGVRYYNTRIN